MELGSAREGTDYVDFGTEFIFPANASSTTIPVEVLSDNLVEPDEVVIVRITGTDNGAVRIGSTQQATITITDNDVAELSIAATTQAAERCYRWAIHDQHYQSVFNPGNGGYYCRW